MAIAQPKYRFNPEPRISANQLAEYVLASPTRRQSILRNAKFSPTFLVIRYAAAREALCRYLTNDARPLDILVKAESEQIQLSKSGGSSFQQTDAALSAEAILAFMKARTEFQKQLPFASFTPNNQSLPKLTKAGVDISIRLDLVARNAGKGLVGGAILQLSKAVASKSWREEHGKVVAALIWVLANEHMTPLGKIDRKLCMAVDVFAGKAVTAPSSYKRLLNDLDAACAEIAALWPGISPPPDYNG